MRQGSQIVCCLEQWGISEWWQTVLALLDLLSGRVYRDLLQSPLSETGLHAYAGVADLAALVNEDEFYVVIVCLCD
jgi:hypothetical protein